MIWRLAKIGATIGVIITMSCSERNMRSLHEQAIVADMHCDTALRLLGGRELARADSAGHVDLDKMKKGGVDLQVFACWIPTDTPAGSRRAKVDEMLDSLYRQIENNSDRIAVCADAAAARKIIESGRVAALPAIENGVAIENNLDNLDHFYRRGVRCLTLTHTSSNDWCISSADTSPAFDGLTPFGRKVIERMNDLGMIIDVSHAHPATVREVLRLSRHPIIASHSCARTICDHDRNLTDDQIKAIAAGGGVIGINFFCGYLSQKWSETVDSFTAAHKAEIDSIRERFKDDRQERHKALAGVFALMDSAVAGIKVDVALVVDHIDHMVKLVGADYVGLGSDFDGVYRLPQGLSDCSMLPNITAELVRRGYSEADIEKILGGNFMRVFAAVCR